MDVLYTKREYDSMVKSYEKKIKILNAQISKLEKKVKKYKEDYEVLLETATEA